MRANRLVMACLLLALILDARAGMAGNEQTNPKRASVIVYVVQDNFTVDVLGRAEQTAARIFAAIDVPIQFRSGAKRKAGEETAVIIEMRLHGRVPSDFHPGAMAFATPFADSGARIHVLCDRALDPALDRGTGAVLGHVMAHEIAHVLEGADHHSAEGVMKARWETPDFQRMLRRALTFDPTDEDLIHAALERRTQRLLPGEAAAR
jgi:hypothetical protein